ncbi:type VI secretion system protein ImpH [Aquabacterium commune]|uniref:Type VI secretion system protein ImpH n=1 Tax=Aquabacterium commune TaxID=70586 RepID=A0A4V3CWZ0_9BURK|nr:type VI secretion system baseplate subunit TssG [Aquabacterium commune]TDP88218.1 type VI secretion system protein ImpH [Aquabacterium commune]
MSTPAWRAPLAVISQLLHAPQQFGFFQAVRLLERWVGLERVQFHNSVSLSFPASEIESLQAHWTSPEVVGLPLQGDGVVSAEGVQRIDLTPACLGLLGVSGALPLFYTEWLAQAEVKGRHAAARAFLDVFSHRSVTLFYQAWCKHRLALRHEQEAVRHRESKGVSPAPRALVSEALALSGMGLKGLRHRLGAERGGVSDEALAYFSGILQQRTLPMAHLQRLLSHYLGVPVRIEPFVGRWYRVPEAGRTVLGGAAVAGAVAGAGAGAGAAVSGGSGVLGRSALLGERVWQRNLCVRLVLGPLDHTPFLRFLPGGAGAQALHQWLGLLLGPALEVEVQLLLCRDAVRGCALDAERSPLSGRLGWDTFLLTEPASSDRQDVHYDIRPGEPEPPLVSGGPAAVKPLSSACAAADRPATATSTTPAPRLFAFA